MASSGVSASFGVIRSRPFSHSPDLILFFLRASEEVLCITIEHYIGRIGLRNLKDKQLRRKYCNAAGFAKIIRRPKGATTPEII